MTPEYLTAWQDNHGKPRIEARTRFKARARSGPDQTAVAASEAFEVGVGGGVVSVPRSPTGTHPPLWPWCRGGTGLRPSGIPAPFHINRTLGRNVKING